ncbi:MAG: DMT family transporter [Candidatus Obscuribacterales bacterium]|nr:DMT family transporter [Candidatus Obscuribacterales bacterium]
MNPSKRLVIPPAYYALASALLFGASTPAAKLLIGQVHPQLLAGLLYFGSGLGLLLVGTIFKAFQVGGREPNLRRSDLPWLAGAIVFGGVAGPLLLMTGLTSTPGGAASLLLNMEAVLTALLAWFAFKENYDRRIILGMISIVVGSIVLTWQPGAMHSVSFGSLAIIGACFCWALDNNLTRNISDADPIQIAAIKGLVAGLVNVGIAVVGGSHLPTGLVVLAASLVGFLGYGVSLVLFIKALRYLGTARTGAYFSTAPFAGAVLSLLFLHEPLTVDLLAATSFMAFGVWLHLTELHEHEHSHTEEEHEHLHTHDEHHQHEHDPEIASGEPHSHRHKHVAITHSHPHYPDTQHRHAH